MLAADWSAVKPTCLPPSRRARLAGDLIEACVPLPDTALSRPVVQSMRGGYVTGWMVAIGVDTHKQWHVAEAGGGSSMVRCSEAIAAACAGHGSEVRVAPDQSAASCEHAEPKKPGPAPKKW